MGLSRDVKMINLHFIYLFFALFPWLLISTFSQITHQQMDNSDPESQ